MMNDERSRASTCTLSSSGEDAKPRKPLNRADMIRRKVQKAQQQRRKANMAMMRAEKSRKDDQDWAIKDAEDGLKDMLKGGSGPTMRKRSSHKASILFGSDRASAVLVLQ